MFGSRHGPQHQELAIYGVGAQACPAASGAGREGEGVARSLESRDPHPTGGEKNREVMMS